MKTNQRFSRSVIAITVVVIGLTTAGTIPGAQADEQVTPRSRRIYRSACRILHLLCEGSSIRAITRMTGASKTTVTKLVVDAGAAAAWYQSRTFRNLSCKRLQIDEIWGFVGAKAKNADPVLKAAGKAGDAWLWMATDAQTKIVPCWHVGSRDGGAAMEFIDDLAARLANRLQITTDGHRAYVDAIDMAFGGQVDYAMLVKLYGPALEGDRRFLPNAMALSRRQSRPS